MTETDPRFIISYGGKYYLTVGLWVYDENQGTAGQKAAAKAVAALYASAGPTQSVSVVPPGQDGAQFGTAIHSVGTAIHPPEPGGV
jgi:hypothetical protein